jgi:outer membrane lipoprotein SlyB
MATKDYVIGVYRNPDEASIAIERLQSRGWTGNDISCIACNAVTGQPEPLNQGDRMEKGAGVGAGVGGAIGLLAGSTLLLIPGVGPVLFAGALASGMTGAVVGGIVGAMSNWGIREDHAVEYERELQQGKTIVAVTGDPQRLAEAQSLMQETPAEKVTLHAETADSKVDA